MNVRNSVVSIASVLVLAACGSTAPVEGAASSSEPIVGGSIDSSDPTVGIVRRSDNGELCTGTLIAPYVVLTAAHCVDVLGTTTPVAPSAVTFYTGSGLGGSRTTYNPASDPALVGHSVQKVVSHPSFTINTAQMGCPNNNDVAVLLLSSVAYISSELSYATDASQLPPAGTSVTAIGYGVNDSGAIGTRYSGTSVVENVTAGKYGNALTVGGPALEQKGDSGGPLVYNRTIIGITMCHDPSVVPGVGWYTRVDVVAPWIESTIQPWIDSWNSACDARCGPPEQSCIASGGDVCGCISGYDTCMTRCTGRVYVPQCRRHILWP